MKVTLLTTLRIIACYNIYANASPFSTQSTPSAPSSNTKNNDALKPITFEVAPNGIVTPGHAGPESRYTGPPVEHRHDNLEDFPVIQTEEEISVLATRSFSVEDKHRIDASTATDPLSRTHHHKYNPFRARGLNLGHGPVIQSPRPFIPFGIHYDNPSPTNPQPVQNEPAYLVIPLSQNVQKLSPADQSSPRSVKDPKDVLSTDLKDKSPTDKSAVSKSTDDEPSRFNYPKGILPTIPLCLNILLPLRDLAERLVYIKEAPHHTLMSACHFQSLNRTHYDGRHVERMREICWDLFETIQQEGLRRWERCISKAEEKVHYDSDAQAEGDPIYKSESGIDKFNFYAYQLTPGSVKEFIAEHPDLSPDDIEWLMHDANSTDTTNSPPSKRSLSRFSTRSKLSDLFKAIFAAEVDVTINKIGQGVEVLVIDELHEYRQKAHAQNKTSNDHYDSSPRKTASLSHSRRDPQSNRVYVHGEWYPIAPVNKYVNHPRNTVELPFSAEDINSYLDFVRETRHLSRKQYRRLRGAVESELKLNSHLESPLESKDSSQSDHPHSMQKRHTDFTVIHKRSGQPPRLGPSFRYPYQWDFPPDLGTNPAYINLILAWNNTVTTEQKAWIKLQLRNVWVLRAGDLCNISRSWTKDLSDESQEIELKFKGLTLQRCKEIWEGTRDNLRVGDYWKRLAKESIFPNKPSTRDPAADINSSH
jgi:hypothetical protein